MLTPPAPHLSATRIDFERLEQVSPFINLGVMGLPAAAKFMKAPESGEVMVIIHIREATDEFVPRIAEFLGGTTEKVTHVCVQPQEEQAQEGFAEALDQLTGGRFKITMVDPEPHDPELEAAVAAVPEPEGLPPASVTLLLSEADFDKLAGGFEDHELDGPRHVIMQRLVPLGDEEVVGTHWAVLYWMGKEWVNTVLCRAFLDHHKIPYQLVRDANDGEWVILTDFACISVRHERARKVRRAELVAEKARESGDELEALFHAPEPGGSDSV